MQTSLYEYFPATVLNGWVLHRSSLHSALGKVREAKLEANQNVGQCPTWWPPCRIYVAPSVKHRKVWLTPTSRVPCSNAANKRNPLKLAGVPQINERISTAWVGCTSVTDDRQTTDRWTGDSIQRSSRSLKTFEIARSRHFRPRLNYTSGSSISIPVGIPIPKLLRWGAVD